jgi:hypothetical protein
MANDPIPPDELTAAITALSALAEAGVEVDGELQVAESTWVIYIHTTYDGEVIVGEYHDAAQADEVFHAAPRPDPIQYGATPLSSSDEHLETEGSS